jgi:D-cysteine desulfhydrase
MHPKEPARVNLAQLPTPIVELKNLARHFDVPRLLMKRDDLTGLELSGNKVRKLEYLVADALAKGCDTLVTHGGFQSNHCRATAAIGARLGLKVRLLLRAPAQGIPDNDGNLFLDRLLGADITLHSVEADRTRRKELIDDAMDAERRAGRRPYFFPVGASVPLGCWGYIRCLHEIAEQLGRDTAVDVYVSVSSSGTFAGLVLGKALLKLNNYQILGIPVSDSVAYFQKDTRNLIAETAKMFSLDVSEEQTPLNLIDGYIGEGYAIPFPSAVETVRLLARKEGILLDPTYTSKGMTGFLESIQKPTRSSVLPLFIHTGGVFGLFARRDLFPI